MYNVVLRINDRLSHLIPISFPTYEHNTKGEQLSKGMKRKLKWTSVSVTCEGPKIWTEIDSTVKESASL